MLAEDKRPWIRDKNNSALPTSECGVYFNSPSMASHIVWHRSVIDGASAPAMGIQNGWRTLDIGNVNFYDKQCKMCKSWQTQSELSINCIRKRLWPGGKIIYYHLVLSSGKPTNMHIERSQPLRNEFCRSGVHLDNMHLQNIPSTVDIVTSGNNLSSVS